MTGRDARNWSVHASRASKSWQSVCTDSIFWSTSFANIMQWHHSSYAAFCSKLGEHSTDARKDLCWNAEAIEHMATDLPTVWSSFVLDLDTEIQRINTAAIETYARIGSAASAAADRSRLRNDTRPAMRTFASNVSHRKHLMRGDISQAMETFEADLESLRIDTLSSAKTAFIGKLLEDTYHAANMEYGKPAFRST
jgi:hypothetical protein